MLSESTTKIITHCFLSLGLPETFAQVYGASLFLGTTSATKIAEKVLLPRSTTYGILRELGTLGLVSEVKDGKALFTPSNPKKLQDLLNKKKKEITFFEEAFSREIDTITDIFNKVQLGVPKVRFYRGEEGLRTVYFDSLFAKEILCLCQGTSLKQPSLSEDPQYLKDFIKESIERKIKTREILQDTPAVAEYKNSYASDIHQILIAPKNKTTTFGHIDKHIYQNKVAFISHDNMLGIIIEDESLFAFEQEQFNTLWNYYASLITQ